jgi:hypothetical protein
LRSLFARSFFLILPRVFLAAPETVHPAPSIMWRALVKKIREQSLAVDGASSIHEDAKLLESPERVSAGARRTVFTDSTVATAGRHHRTLISALPGGCAATFA